MALEPASQDSVLKLMTASPVRSCGREKWKKCKHSVTKVKAQKGKREKKMRGRERERERETEREKQG